MGIVAYQPEGFRHVTPMTVRYGDMDTLGHVNNAKYLTYIEQARVMYFEQQRLWDGNAGQWGAIVARISIDYKTPLTLADGTVNIWTRCVRLGNKSLDMESVILTERNGEFVTAAQAVAVLVVYDYVNNVTVALPDAWREKLKAYEPALNG